MHIVNRIWVAPHVGQRRQVGGPIVQPPAWLLVSSILLKTELLSSSTATVWTTKKRTENVFLVERKWTARTRCWRSQTSSSSSSTSPLLPFLPDSVIFNDAVVDIFCLNESTLSLKYCMACFCLIDAAYYLECVKNLITTASIMRESYATRLTLMQRSRKKHSLREKFSLIGSQKKYK